MDPQAPQSRYETFTRQLRCMVLSILRYHRARSVSGCCRGYVMVSNDKAKSIQQSRAEGSDYLLIQIKW